MADLNARIKPKKSSTTGEVPQAADLEVAELAVNTADGKLFVKHTDDSIKEISGGTDITTESIDSLNDVDTTTSAPTDGQVLTWVNANNQWEPAGIPALGAGDLSDVSTVPSSAVAVTPDLLLYCEGTDGGAVFTDSSANNYSITVDNVTTSATQAKYGSTSAHFTNTAYELKLSNADSSSVAFFGTNDFTVESWIYVDTASSNSGLFRYGITATIVPSWGLNVNSNPGSEALNFNYSTNGTSSTSVGSGTIAGVTFLNEWHHVAVCRTGSTLKGYVDGAEVFSAAISGSIVEQPSYPLEIGTGFGSGIIGYMDNIRITNGTAAYTGGFTPPNATFSLGPANGQVLTWVDANSQWEPVGSISKATLQAEVAAATDFADFQARIAAL